MIERKPNPTISRDDVLVVGITGFARSGKDTFAKIIKKNLEEQGKEVHILSFASSLKVLANKISIPSLGIDCFTDCNDEKPVIRPLLVSLGEFFRGIDEFFWVRMVSEEIEKIQNSKPLVVIIPDVRFENEASWIKQKNGSNLVAIKREGINPPNKQESENIPKIFNNFVDFTVSWENELNCKNLLTSPMLNGIVLETIRKIYAI